MTDVAEIARQEFKLRLAEIAAELSMCPVSQQYEYHEELREEAREIRAHLTQEQPR